MKQKHHPNCNWEKTKNKDCSWKDAHNYCPHPEHFCNCNELTTMKENISVEDKLKMLTFGRVLIDKKHCFLGKLDPELCLIADSWYSADDGLNQDIWIDHFRGHYKISVRDLINDEKFEITFYTIDCSRNIRRQMESLKKIILNS